MDNIPPNIHPQDTPISQETSQFPSNPLCPQQQLIISQDHHHYNQILSKPFHDHGLNPFHDLQTVTGTQEVRFKRSKSSSSIDFRSSKDEENLTADHHQPYQRKKIIHRDIERQRRQDMSSLYSSLRSLLPLEYLKGKRSISDHIHGAVNYIKHMEEKIQNMNDKRNELKKVVDSGLDSSMEVEEGSEEDSLTIEPCFVGVEVIINSCLRHHGFPLSRVLGILTREGFNVVSCISTKVNQRMIHSIKSEVSEGRDIDLSEMQQKLTNSVIKRFAD